MHLLRRVWAILLPADRRRSFLILALMLVTTALEMLSIGLVVPVLGLMTANGAWLPPAVRAAFARVCDPGSFSSLLLLMACLVVVYALKSLLILGVSFWQARCVRRAQANVSRRAFAAVLAQPWSYHLQHSTGSTVHAVEESRAFAQVCMDLLQVVSEILVGAGLLGLLLWVDPVGALLVAGMLGLAFWLLNRVVRPWSRRWADARNRHLQELRQRVQQGLDGIKEVKLHGCDGVLVEEFRLHSDAVARLATLQRLVEQVPRPWFEVLSVTTLFLLTAVMAWHGEPVTALVPVLGLYATVAFRMLPSLNQATIAVQRLRQAEPMIAALERHLDLERSVPAPAPGTLVTFRDAIRLERVCYRYPQAGVDVLDGVDVRIPRGTAVGFVGSSGAGKSTLIDVLLGLLAPTSGRVTVDGFDIQGNVRGWQEIVGYVPQSLFLVDGSIRRNVAFGVPDAVIDDAFVHAALRAARLDDFVSSLPDGVHTVVGERGVRLSGGQRQRLAIARALYLDPHVLVLDEATSALDADTEREVMAAVEALHGTKTLILVAHRLSTLSGCDVLHRIEGGRIVRSGSFAEVVAADRAGSAAGSPGHGGGAPVEAGRGRG